MVQCLILLRPGGFRLSNDKAAAATAVSPDRPAYAIARSLIPVCEGLIHNLDSLTAQYTADLEPVRGAALGLTGLAANMPDDAPLTELCAELLQISHAVRTVIERNAQVDRTTALPLTPRAAAQLTGELAGLLVQAMDCEDRLERLATAPSRRASG